MEQKTSHRLPRWIRLTRPQWAAVLLLSIATAALAYWLQSEKADRYEATATLLFRSTALDQTLFGSQVFSAGGDAGRNASTNLQLIASAQLAERVRGELGLAESAQDILANTKVGNVGASDLASITYEAASPELAAAVANALATQFVALRREVDRGAVEEAIQLARTRIGELRAESPGEPDLSAESQRLDDLEVLAALQTGNVEVTDPAVESTTPVGPSPAAVAARAGVLQLVFLTALFGLGRRLRDPVDGVGDLQELGLPVLGELPRTRGMSLGMEDTPSEAYESGLRLLLGNLRFVSKRSGSTVVVLQSTKSGEGKSTVALQLARLAARSGTRTCLVDADLRSRALTRAIGDPEGAGLSILLTGLEGADRAGTDRMVADTLSRQSELIFLGSGPEPPNPGDLLARDAAKTVVATLRDHFELIIIDAPPTLVVSDVTGILPVADAVIVVVRRSFAQLHAVSRLIERLGLLGSRPVGTVLNLAPRGDNGAYYYGQEDDQRSKLRRRVHI